MNRYFHAHESEPLFPGSYYVFLEEYELRQYGDSLYLDLHFNGFEYSDVETFTNSPDFSLSDFYREFSLHSFIVTYGMGRNVVSPYGLFLIRDIKARLFPNTWYRIDTHKSRPEYYLGRAVLECPHMRYFGSLYTSGIRIHGSLRRLDVRTVHKLSALLDLETIPKVDILTDGVPFPRMSDINSAVVHDIGQGNAVSLRDSHDNITCFVDFGRGVKQNYKTYDNPGLDQLKSNLDVPIFLTHWDKDHWSLGPWLDSTARCQWFAPVQKVGPEGAAFMHHLARNKKITLIKKFTGISDVGSSLQFGHCKWSDRNNSGLVFVASNKEKKILLPGDASYEAIPRSLIFRSQFHAVVVPHHGGLLDHDPSVIPVPTDNQWSKLVYSVGRGNTYRHPHLRTKWIHHMTGWDSQPYNPALYTSTGKLGCQNDIVLPL